MRVREAKMLNTYLCRDGDRERARPVGLPSSPGTVSARRGPVPPPPAPGLQAAGRPPTLVHPELTVTPHKPAGTPISVCARCPSEEAGSTHLHRPLGWGSPGRGDSADSLLGSRLDPGIALGVITATPRGRGLPALHPSTICWAAPCPGHCPGLGGGDSDPDAVSPGT